MFIGYLGHYRSRPSHQTRCQKFESVSESKAKGSVSAVLCDVVPKTYTITSSISACRSSLRMSVSSDVLRALLIPVMKNDFTMATLLHEISCQASAIQSTSIWWGGGGILANCRGHFPSSLKLLCFIKHTAASVDAGYF